MENVSFYKKEQEAVKKVNETTFSRQRKINLRHKRDCEVLKTGKPLPV